MQGVSAQDLRAIDLFEGLQDDDLTEIASWFEVKEVTSGEVLAREGASGYAFMVLGSASAVVAHGDDVINELAPGDFFGEAAILGEGRRTATVTASSAGTVWVLFGTRFREMGSRFPAQQAAVQAAFESRVNEEDPKG